MFNFDDEVVDTSVEEETAVAETVEDATETVAEEGTEVEAETVVDTVEVPAEEQTSEEAA